MSYRDWVTDYKYRRAVKRLRKIPTEQIIQWANATLVGCQMALDSYDRTQDILALVEMRSAILGLQATVEVLQDRA